MSEISKSVAGILLALVIFLAVSFVLQFQFWPWQTHDIYRSGSHFGFTIGSTVEQSMIDLRRKQSVGEIEKIIPFGSSTKISDVTPITTSIKGRESEQLYAAAAWLIYTSDCDCRLFVTFKDDQLFDIQHTKLLLLSGFRVAT